PTCRRAAADARRPSAWRAGRTRRRAAGSEPRRLRRVTMRRRVATAGGVAILPLLVIAAHAKKPTVDCLGGRFLVQGRQLVAGTGTGPDDVMIDRASRVVSIGSGCPAVSATVLPTLEGSRLHAVWPVGAGSGPQGRGVRNAR